MTHQDRLNAANELLAVIGTCGRLFFNHGGVISHMERDTRGRVWFIDSHTKKRCYTHYKYNWRGFTNGGTMRWLIDSLRDYIVHGTLVDCQKHFGPWPDWVCGNGDRWGYGLENMEKVRAEAKRLGVCKE